MDALLHGQCKSSRIEAIFGRYCAFMCRGQLAHVTCRAFCSAPAHQVYDKIEEGADVNFMFGWVFTEPGISPWYYGSKPYTAQVSSTAQTAAHTCLAARHMVCTLMNPHLQVIQLPMHAGTLF